MSSAQNPPSVSNPPATQQTVPEYEYCDKLTVFLGGGEERIFTQPNFLLHNNGLFEVQVREVRRDREHNVTQLSRNMFKIADMKGWKATYIESVTGIESRTDNVVSLKTET